MLWERASFRIHVGRLVRVDRRPIDFADLQYFSQLNPRIKSRRMNIIKHVFKSVYVIRGKISIFGFASENKFGAGSF